MALRSRKAAVTLLIILVAVFLAVYFGRNHIANSSPISLVGKAAGDKNAETTLAGSTKKTEAIGKTAASSNSNYQLPPMNKPIDEIFDDLKLASDQGEAKATCRLALELLKCQLSLQHDEKKLEKHVTDKYPGRTEEELFYIRKSYLGTLDLYQECKKLPSDKLTDTADLLERAANQGQLDAMVIWASGQWIKGRYGNSDAYLQDPAFNRWQQNAIPVMNSALQQGSYTAVREWLHAYMLDGGLKFYSLIKDDPKKMYAFMTLAELLENDIPTPPRELPSRDAIAAEAEGRRMYKDWFHGTPIGKENLNNARVLLDDREEDRRDLCNASR